jgi:hypothetical protein
MAHESRKFSDSFRTFSEFGRQIRTAVSADDRRLRAAYLKELLNFPVVPSCDMNFVPVCRESWNQNGK